MVPIFLFTKFSAKQGDDSRSQQIFTAENSAKRAHDMFFFTAKFSAKRGDDSGHSKFLPLKIQPSEEMTWSQYFYLPLNFQPSEGMTVGHSKCLPLKIQPSEEMTSAPSFNYFLVWVCCIITICSPFGEQINMAVQGQIYR